MITFSGQVTPAALLEGTAESNHHAEKLSEFSEDVRKEAAKRCRDVEKAVIHVCRQAAASTPAGGDFPIVYDNEFPTAYTDGKRICLNPWFIASAAIGFVIGEESRLAAVLGVIAHEVGHMWFSPFNLKMDEFDDPADKHWMTNCEEIHCENWIGKEWEDGLIQNPFKRYMAASLLDVIFPEDLPDERLPDTYFLSYGRQISQDLKEQVRDAFSSKYGDDRADKFEELIDEFKELETIDTLDSEDRSRGLEIAAELREIFPEATPEVITVCMGCGSAQQDTMGQGSGGESGSGESGQQQQSGGSGDEEGKDEDESAGGSGGLSQEELDKLREAVENAREQAKRDAQEAGEDAKNTAGGESDGDGNEKNDGSSQDTGGDQQPGEKGEKGGSNEPSEGVREKEDPNRPMPTIVMPTEKEHMPYEKNPNPKYLDGAIRSDKFKKMERGYMRARGELASLLRDRRKKIPRQKEGKLDVPSVIKTVGDANIVGRLPVYNQTLHAAKGHGNTEVVVALDYSGSMQGEFWELSVEAYLMKQMFDYLRMSSLFIAWSSGKPGGTMYGTKETAKHGKVVDGDAADPGEGGTSFDCAVLPAVDCLENSPRYHKIYVTMSDGVWSESIAAGNALESINKIAHSCYIFYNQTNEANKPPKKLSDAMGHHEGWQAHSLGAVSRIIVDTVRTSLKKTAVSGVRL